MRQEEKRKIDDCDMEKFGTLGSSEKTIAILRDTWWAQTAKQQGDKTRKKNQCEARKILMSAQMLQMPLIEIRNVAPSLTECVVDGQIAKASNK